MSMSEVVTLRMSGALAPAHMPALPYDVRGPVRRGLLSPATRELVTRRMAYGKAAAQLYPVGPKSERLGQLIAEVAERIGDSDPPSAHSVYRWVRRYVASDYNTAVFMQDVDVVRKRPPRKLTDQTPDRLRHHIQTLLGAYLGATLHGITNLALAMTAKDMGYLQFQTKEGVEELVDDYIPRENTRLKSLAERRAQTLDGRSSKLGNGT